MNGYAIGRQNGWMSANDIRELENLDRIPEEEGGDLYLSNRNMSKLKDAGIFAKKEREQNEEVLKWENQKVLNQETQTQIVERILFLNGTIAEDS